MSYKGKQKSDETTRIAVIIPDRCRPYKCGLQCKTNCPVNKTDKKCITVETKSKRAEISEVLCIGCNICVKKCPFEAICIENLPSALESQVSYRYGPNAFKLHRLPSPRPGQILGLVGENGTGKSTALYIMKNEFQPNFGDFSGSYLETKEIIKRYRGTELQNYFTKLYDGYLKVDLKIQYVDYITKTDKAQDMVGDLIEKYRKKSKDKFTFLVKQLQMENLLERQVNYLSGGELYRFALLMTALRDFYVSLVDEPSSYLDIKQRLVASEVVRGIVADNTYKYCIVVEHDLAVLDYMSDYVSLLYGQPGVYGIITLPYSCSEGINVFLRGYIPTENVRFRREEIKFHVYYADASNNAQQKAEKTYKPAKKEDQAEEAGEPDDIVRKDPVLFNSYPNMIIKLGEFTLHIKAGVFNYNQITLILGENGTGKTTFIKTIAGSKGYHPIFENDTDYLPKLAYSLKPQTLSPNFDGTVQDLLNLRIGETFNSPAFYNNVVYYLNIKHLLTRALKHLSGGELQRVATILALGKNANLYLIDEPSAYLDATQRLVVAKVIKRFIIGSGKCGYIIEHDFLMSLYLADNVIVFSGYPGVECTANEPTSLAIGMNKFLGFVGVTFRRDAETLRPRVNKPNSAKDKDQKISGQYFADFIDDEK